MGLIARLLGIGKPEASAPAGPSETGEGAGGVNESKATAGGSEVTGNINKGCASCGGRGCSCGASGCSCG